MGEYQVIMDGGGPWGIRLQGGKDFGVPLNVARVTPGSKASMKGLTAGDQIISINNTETCDLTHMEAQNLIKGAGDILQLCLKQGQGAVDVGSGGFKAQPAQTLYQTDLNHSAGVDHKYNAKPKEYITSRNQSAGGVTYHSTPLKKFDPEESKASDTSSSSKKFDPGEYARKKKEELENYKKESKPDTLVDSDVLQMLKKTSITDQKPPAGLQPTAGLQHSTDTEGATTSQPPKPPPAPSGKICNPPPPTSPMMVAPNPYQLPIKAVVASEGANPIMNALQSRMKEMKIDKDRLDRASSVTNENKGKYLSQTSRDSAARPKSPSYLPVEASPTASGLPPRSPSNFRSSIKGGGNPTGVQGANVLVGDLKDRLKNDRMTLGLKATRGGGGNTQRKVEEGYKAKDSEGYGADDMGEEL